ncbi:MAG: adenosine kinase [Nitrospina sp.]|nr:adenosine kinase [Nitrospina sp.]
MTFDVVGIGNALVDIEVRVEEDFVKSLGVVKGGMTLSTIEDQQRILDAVRDHAHKISSGGSAANTIHGIGAMGGKGYYLGRVADDDYGQHYTDDMRDCGVGFPGPDAANAGTGTCVVLVTPDSERTMFTHLGISSELHPDNVDEAIVDGAGAVYIEGYLWTGDETRNAAIKMADAAREAGVPVAFTLSDGFIVNAFREALIDFIRWKVDILFCNDVEARAMAGTQDTEAAFEQLRGMVDTLFLTRGKQGALACNAANDHVEIGSFPVQAVDTTGAGDLFAGGALFGLTRKLPLKQCGILGSYCAGQVVSYMGARLPKSAVLTVNEILNRYPGP